MADCPRQLLLRDVAAGALRGNTGAVACRAVDRNPPAPDVCRHALGQQRMRAGVGFPFAAVQPVSAMVQAVAAVWRISAVSRAGHRQELRTFDSADAGAGGPVSLIADACPGGMRVLRPAGEHLAVWICGRYRLCRPRARTGMAPQAEVLCGGAAACLRVHGRGSPANHPGARCRVQLRHAAQQECGDPANLRGADGHSGKRRCHPRKEAEGRCRQGGSFATGSRRAESRQSSRNTQAGTDRPASRNGTAHQADGARGDLRCVFVARACAPVLRGAGVLVHGASRVARSPAVCADADGRRCPQLHRTPRPDALGCLACGALDGVAANGVEAALDRPGFLCPAAWP